MKMSGHIAVTAIGLVLASAGALMPINGMIGDLEAEVRDLEDSAASTVPVQVEIKALQARIIEFTDIVDTRTIALCPDTPTASRAFESALARAVRDSGLTRVSMDREPGQRVTGLRSFQIALKVEGTVSQMHHLLVLLEELPWVNRVLRMAVEQGEMIRTVDLRIAVVLESEPV